MTGSHNRRVAKGGTCVKHARELKSHVSWSTTRQNFQSDQVVSLRLKLLFQEQARVTKQLYLLQT